LRGTVTFSTSCPTTTDPKYPSSKTNPSFHTKRP
jgi:hypothetical protein